MSEVGSGSSEIRMSEVGGRRARGWDIDGGSSESRGQRSKVGGERWEEEGGRWEENQARALAGPWVLGPRLRMLSKGSLGAFWPRARVPPRRSLGPLGPQL